MTDKPSDHDPDIVTSSMSEPARAPDAALNDQEDRWLETVLASLPKRSSEAKEALLKALVNGEGSMPLLGLALTDTENTGENHGQNGDSNQQPMLAPLLGTTTFQHTETLEKSSERRSPKRVCYGNLLRENGSPSAGKSQRTVTDETSGCYLALAARWLTSTCSKVSFMTASFSVSTL